jgi:hypothetical protein
MLCLHGRECEKDKKYAHKYPKEGDESTRFEEYEFGGARQNRDRVYVPLPLYLVPSTSELSYTNTNTNRWWAFCLSGRCHVPGNLKLHLNDLPTLSFLAFSPHLSFVCPPSILS